jgi:hypothetical protein
LQEASAVLEKAIAQMEDDAETIEGEWGTGRSLEELERAGELPEALLAARAYLASLLEGTK